MEHTHPSLALPGARRLTCPPHPTVVSQEVIKETHGHYKNLLAGKSDGGKLWLGDKVAA